MVRKRIPSSRAFSLNELIVAIGLTAILVALLTGGYGHVRQQSRITGDLNNFRQIAVALHSYLGEHAYRFPAVIGARRPGDAGAFYAHVALARQMGMTTDFYASTHDRKALGAWISPGDQNVPPFLSPLRSYSVNYFAGEIYTLSDSTTAYYYHEVNQPSRKIYLLPGSGQHTDPIAQARFTPASPPLIEGGAQVLGIRFYPGNRTPALWMDGHASVVTLDYLKRNAPALFYPRREPPSESQ